nr:transposase [uncultured Cohaesibacter sp.]
MFWLSAAQWAVIESLLPNNKGGARRVDDRRGISGIIHVLKVGCRWGGQTTKFPVIPGRANCKRSIRYDERRYKDRHLIENAFCRLKDFHRAATRYDKLARNFLSAVTLATLIAFWI